MVSRYRHNPTTTTTRTALLAQTAHPSDRPTAVRMYREALSTATSHARSDQKTRTKYADSWRAAYEQQELLLVASAPVDLLMRVTPAGFCTQKDERKDDVGVRVSGFNSALMAAVGVFGV